jgi:hypothetical protein
MKRTLPITLILFAVLGCGGGELFKPKTYTTSKPIVMEDVEIKPLGWHSWPFKAEKDARVNGSYSTVSGADHEIIFYIVDAANKDAIERDQTGSFYFRSLDDRKVKHLTSVMREIPPGDYFVMFHNESKTSDHTVKVRMHLEQ